MNEINKNFMLPLQLQLFAGEGEDGADKGDDKGADDADDKEDDDDDSEDEDEDIEEDEEDGKKSSKKSQKMYSQKEVDRMMAKRLARQSRQMEKSKNSSTKLDKNKPNDKEDERAKKEKDFEEKLSNLTIKIARTEIKSTMLDMGIDTAKIAKAMKLVDIEDVLDDGEVDTKALKREVKALIKDFPDLVKKAENGFKFGVDGKKDDPKKIDDELNSIFGNNKK